MSQQYKPVMEDTFRASGGVSPHRFVGYDGAHCGAGKKAAGASRYGADDTKLGNMVVIGTAVVEAGGAFSAGDPLTSDASGKAVLAADLSVELAAGSDSTDVDGAHTFAGGVLPVAINGYAKQDSSGDGVKVEIKLV